MNDVLVFLRCFGSTSKRYPHVQIFGFASVEKSTNRDLEVIADFFMVSPAAIKFD